jgi:tryptophanyl-tRNA synthetase
MGLDGQAKMSKSKGNTIPLFDPPDAFWNKLRGAFTDPQRLRKTDPGRPEVCNIYTMHTVLSPPEEIERTHKECTTAQRGCVDCKKILFEHLDRELVPLRKRREELVANPGRVREMLGDCAKRARAMANKTMAEVRSSMGLGSGALSHVGAPPEQ